MDEKKIYPLCSFESNICVYQLLNKRTLNLEYRYWKIKRYRFAYERIHEINEFCESQKKYLFKNTVLYYTIDR